MKVVPELIKISTKAMPYKKKKPPVKDQKMAFLSALTKHLGILTPALAECRMSYHTYAKWFKDDPEFRAACIGVDNVQADYVESKLMNLIEEGNPTAILFYLKCRRPEKWSDRQRLDINVTKTEFQIGGSVPIELIDTKEIKMIENGIDR